MRTIHTMLGLVCCLAWLLPTAHLQAQEQLVDTEFRTDVADPAYPDHGPVVAIDEAHANFHTATGQYRPFAELLRSDGYEVVSSTARFVPGALDGYDVLVIANALPEDDSDPTRPAFTEQECEVLEDWIRNGGSLLFVVDHAPFGAAAEILGRRLGVAMGKGWAFDGAEDGGVVTNLVFSRENGLLGSHPILRGRAPREEVGRVQAFTGQSLGVPEGATVLMAFGATAREAATREDVQAEDAAARSADAEGNFGARSVPVAGRAQGIAMLLGEGRVVVLGEASLLSAQLIRYPDGREIRFGMNVPGNDNRQFALNVLHWLSGLLD